MNHARSVIALTAVALLSGAPGYAFAGKPTDQELNRNVTLAGGYTLHAAVTGLNFPTGIAFGQGVIYISEAGGIAGTAARIVRVNEDGTTSLVADGFSPPVTGVTFHDGWLYVAQRGTITRLHPDGSGRQDIITGLPASGDHTNEQITFGSDGMMYFTVGTATNSSVVGPDDFQGAQTPPPDVPCEDIRVHGINFRSEDPRTADPADSVSTGPFKPFGTTASEGGLIPGAALCNGAILRANPDGTGIQVYAWGFRNPFGLRFDAGGQLWATNNGMDERGSRPVEGDVDVLFKAVNHGWYGWPDFAHGVPVNELSEEGSDTPVQEPVLAQHPALSPEASGFALFDDHVSTDGFDFSTSDRFRFVGDAFVAETGSLPPITGAETFFGYRVTRVDAKSGKVSVFLANKSGLPSFATGKPGINKPIDVKFDPDNPERMYVVDLGAFLPGPGTETVNPVAEPGSGVVWLVSRRRVAGDQGQPGNVTITRVAPIAGSRSVSLSYALSRDAAASIRVYDVAGRLVRTLVERPQEAGDHQAVWDTRDQQGRAVPRGLYFARAAAGADRDERKILVVGSE